MSADYHVHTEFSNDSVYPMEQVVKDAIASRGKAFPYWIDAELTLFL